MSRASNVHQLLGLARRAGAVVPGTAGVRDAIRSGDAKLVLLAGDASPVQLAKIRRTMEGRPVPEASLGSRAELGAALGHDPISAVAVTSAPLADRMAAELGDAVRQRGAVAAAVEAAQD